jgi:S-(hydroxymethyl)glutathione dehydrogenase / alcohol dehydrogenase
MTPLRIRAAVCRAFGAPLVVEEVVLAPPGPGEVRVRLAAVAVCHSDILYAEGAWGGHLPAVYGHEAAGRVEALGAGVTGLAPGDPVVVTMIRACGACHFCATGRPTMCATPWNRAQGTLRLPDDTVVEHGLNVAAFAEAVVVHASQVAPVPEGLPMEQAALLACGVITGAGAVMNTARVESGASVVVVGAGGVGLNTIQAARIAGADPVIAIDLSDEKLAAARDFGATDALRADMPKLRRAVLERTGGLGAEYVFVNVGSTSAYQGAFPLACKGGAVVAVGMPPSGATVAVEPVVLAATSQRFLGSNLGNAVIARDVPLLAGLARAGRLKLAELVTGRFALDEINEAIAQAREGRALRNVILLEGMP